MCVRTFDELCATQLRFDMFIAEKHDVRLGVPTSKLLSQRILSFFVELGETIEVWHSDNHSTLLEEYIDGLHFILSIRNQFGISTPELSDVTVRFMYSKEGYLSFWESYYSEDFCSSNIDSVFAKIVRVCSVFAKETRCFKFWSEFPGKTGADLKKEFFEFLGMYVYLGIILGFDGDAVCEAFMLKDSVNISRQLLGY